MLLNHTLMRMHNLVLPHDQDRVCDKDFPKGVGNGLSSELGGG